MPVAVTPSAAEEENLTISDGSMRLQRDAAGEPAIRFVAMIAVALSSAR
jgi:hypothetical protein